jgi:regulator of sirC expression with transglutaminase-like and TPR domain
MTIPQYCRPESYALFREGMYEIATMEGLLKAATAVSQDAENRLSYVWVAKRIESLATRVIKEARSDSPTSRVAHLHRVLFDEEGFVGNRENYYFLGNSYLPTVLETKRGIPVTLTLIYVSVARLVGLEADGINAPAHFLARIKDSEGDLYVDPFSGGQALTYDEALERLERIAGRPIPKTPELLEPAANVQWILRILANLERIYAATSMRRELSAIAEFQSLVRELPLV